MTGASAEGISIDVNNRERPLVNGVHLGNLNADEVYQDRDGQVYIDFDSEFAKLAQTNLALSQQTPQKHYTAADFPDWNTREIDIRQFTADENGQIVISLAAEVLSIPQPLRIRGLSTEATGNTIVINVDTVGKTDYNSQSPIKVYYGDDTDPRSNKDADDYGDNHLLWNFHNQQHPLTGTLQFNGRFQGSILAPSANLMAHQNMDGNLIANRVEIWAESHRWDLQDSSAPEETEKPGTDEEDEDEEKPGTDEEEDLEEPEKPDPDEEEDPEEPEKPDPGEEEDLEEPEKPDPGEEEELEEPDKPDPGEEEDLEEPEKPDPGEETPEPETPAVPDPSPEVEELTSTDTESPSQLESDLNAALVLPASQRPAAVKRVLRRIDTAITAAHQANDSVRATRLEALRTRGLAALSTSRLPQTGENQSPVIATIGTSLMIIMIVIGWTITKKRRQNR